MRGNFDGKKRLAQDMPGHVQQLIQLSRGQNWSGVDADWSELDGVHIGATWRIRLKRPCAAVVWLYVKLLSPLFVSILSVNFSMKMFSQISTL